MITSMSDLLCVTNRALCREDFLKRVDSIAACAPKGIILREKDLRQEEYRALAEQVMEICQAHHVPCILHSFVQAALALHADAFHAPLSVLRSVSKTEREHFAILGASCHSVAEAQEAEGLGCTYITAGHIFATDCKKGVPPRGPEFLRAVCAAVSVPVYAIGGISAENIATVRACGAAGACVMSGAMECDDPAAYFESFEKAGERNDLSC